MDPVGSSLHGLFEAQAAETPDIPAIVSGRERMSYAQLDRATDSLGDYLRSHGVSTEEPVGIFMETCAEFIVASLGALKAGGAFMPMALDSPERLLRAMVAESRPRVVVTKAQHLSRLPTLGEFPDTHVLAIDEDRSWTGLDAAAPGPDVTGDHLAFIPYTSGTTGDPKGVMLTGASVISSYQARYRFSSYAAGDRVACNIFFPWEYFRPLLKGATVYVVPDDVVFLPRALAAFISENGVTEMLFTPSLLQGVLSSGDRDAIRARLASLRVVWLNGEVVPTSLLRQALEVLPRSARMFNTYSISETHDVCTVELTGLTLDGRDVCPVGLPMDGVTVRVMPEGGSVLTSEGSGELFIGGRGLARGYLGRPDLDAERFLRQDGERYYATGDLAEIGAQGMTTIVGRDDSMVKIRGYTVYLGAVEEMLRKHCGVADTAVAVEAGDETNKRLVAYVVRGPGATWRVEARSGTSRDLRNLLERHLPHYMVPSRYMELQALPLNQQTGKLDRKALPPLRQGRSIAKERPRLPENATAAERRRVLRELWGEALDIDAGSLDDHWDFFDLGGHSLAGLGLTLDVERVFGVTLQGTEIYEHPTIDALAAYLEDGGPRMEPRVSLADDAKLDAGIAPTGEIRATRLSEASAILVTGTTGFLGAFLLDELLRATGDGTRFYCLARHRASGQDQSANRVLEALKSYGLPGQSLGHRVVPVTGDLTQPRLGLEEKEYGQLAEEIDLVFHCAASVNYVYPYATVKPHTVGGTVEVLRFACSGRAKPVQYISSNGVFPGGDDTPYLENDQIAGFVDRMEGGYNQAKWVAECLVWSAVSRGLPVCLFRPGNIGHHSGTGVVNPNDFLSLIMKACVRSGLAPWVPDWMFEMTPVDFLVRAIRKISDDPAHFGKVYNVVQQEPVPADRVFEYMESNGYVTGRVSLEDWKSALQAAADRENDMELRVLVQALDSVEPYLTDTSVYDVSRFSEAVSGMGMALPAADVEYVTRFLRVS